MAATPIGDLGARQRLGIAVFRLTRLTARQIKEMVYRFLICALQA